jgi:hypothetical protein
MIRGRNLDKQLLTAGNRTVFDLSASAAGEMVLLHPTNDVYINNVYIIYTEATSADAGKLITIGKTKGGAEYMTYTSLVSQAINTKTTLDEGELVTATVPAGTPIWIAHEGGKTGTGECFVVITYTVLN